MAFIALSTDLQSLAILFVCLVLTLLNWLYWLVGVAGGREGYVSIAFYLIFSSKMWCVAGFLGRRRRYCCCWCCCYCCWTSWHVQIGHLPIYCALSLLFFRSLHYFSIRLFFHRSTIECEGFSYLTFFHLAHHFIHTKLFLLVGNFTSITFN